MPTIDASDLSAALLGAAPNASVAKTLLSNIKDDESSAEGGIALLHELPGVAPGGLLADDCDLDAVPLFVLALVAASPSTTPRLLGRLAAHPQGRIVRAVAENPRTPAAAQELMLSEAIARQAHSIVMALATMMPARLFIAVMKTHGGLDVLDGRERLQLLVKFVARAVQDADTEALWDLFTSGGVDVQNEMVRLAARSDLGIRPSELVVASGRGQEIVAELMRDPAEVAADAVVDLYVEMCRTVPDFKYGASRHISRGGQLSAYAVDRFLESGMDWLVALARTYVIGNHVAGTLSDSALTTLAREFTFADAAKFLTVHYQRLTVEQVSDLVSGIAELDAAVASRLLRDMGGRLGAATVAGILRGTTPAVTLDLLARQFPVEPDKVLVNLILRDLCPKFRFGSGDSPAGICVLREIFARGRRTVDDDIIDLVINLSGMAAVRQALRHAYVRRTAVSERCWNYITRRMVAELADESAWQVAVALVGEMDVEETTIDTWLTAASGITAK